MRKAAIGAFGTRKEIDEKQTPRSRKELKDKCQRKIKACQYLNTKRQETREEND